MDMEEEDTDIFPSKLVGQNSNAIVAIPDEQDAYDGMIGFSELHTNYYVPLPVPCIAFDFKLIIRSLRTKIILYFKELDRSTSCEHNSVPRSVVFSISFIKWIVVSRMTILRWAHNSLV